MTIFSNVAFAIMVMDTLNYFLPVISGEEQYSFRYRCLFADMGIQIFLVLSGTRIAGSINIVGTLAKTDPAGGLYYYSHAVYEVHHVRR